MRTAAEILDEFQLDMGTELTDGQYHQMKLAINKGREEAIIKCADIAKVNMPTHTHLHGTKNVNRKQIIQLIKELK